MNDEDKDKFGDVFSIPVVDQPKVLRLNEDLYNEADVQAEVGERRRTIREGAL